VRYRRTYAAPLAFAILPGNTFMVTVIGVFDERSQVESAIDKLWHAGFTREQVGILIPGEGVVQAETPTGQREAQAAQGAVAGSLTGGTVGTLVGALAAVFLPGIGTVLAGGILAAMAAGAAAGAAMGAYFGPFVAMGLSEDEARSYTSELKAGRTIVVVNAGEESEKARLILRQHGARFFGASTNR
jgi:hypothetical protein